MQTGLNHAIHRRRAKKRNAPLFLQLMDKSAYLMGAVTVAVNLPQLFTIWTTLDVRGVSLISWIGFLLGSFFWLFYGIFHREKPIVIINGSLIIVQGLIVTGLLYHSGALPLGTMQEFHQAILRTIYSWFS